MEYAFLHGVILWCYVKLIQKRQGVSIKRKEEGQIVSRHKKELFVTEVGKEFPITDP